ncbi:MAG: hypothetical protein M3Q03_05595 [Chloroflexota bacterium]|nr:hypothetical protein [Chloroflexota bacterium]
MSDLLLRPSRRLTGPHRVAATLRPLRLAFLVHPDDPGVALAAVDACCLLWGGPFQCLIPCPPGGEPEALWSQMLEKHDPDEVVDLVGAASAFVERQQETMHRRVRRWQHPTETMQLFGVLATSVLRRQVERGRVPSNAPILNLHPLFAHPLALPLAYRYGHLERRPMDRHDRLRAAYVTARLEDLAHVQVVDPASNPIEELIRLVTEHPLAPSTPERPGWNGPLGNSLVDILRGFELGMRTTRALGRDTAEATEGNLGRGDPYHHQIVVLGEANSVPDLCLAWNLRARRLGEPPPIWVAPGWLAQPEVCQRLESVRAANEGRARGHGGIGTSWLGFASASVGYEALVEATTSMPQSAALRWEELGRLFPDEVHLGLERRSTAAFVDGSADIALPEAEDLADFSRGEMLGVTVVVPGWRLPRMPAPRFASSDDVVRVAVDGLVGELDVGYRPPPELVTVKTRDGAEALSAVADAAGLRATISDKGRLAIALLELFGSSEALTLLSSSLVYGLLVEMGTGAVPRQAVQQALARHLPDLAGQASIDAVVAAFRELSADDGLFEPGYFTWSVLREKLGGNADVAQWVVAFLVERGILFRGFEVRCRNCGLRRWQPVDLMASAYACDACQVTAPLPLPVDDVLEWRYRVNGVVARG